jgi:hypothetical protein
LLLTLREENEKHRQQTLNLIYNSTDVECLSMLRLTRAPFFALCNLFRHRGLVPKTEGCTVEEQVATGSSTVHPKGLVYNPKLSIETVHRHFRQVLYVVGELKTKMIKPPSTAIHPKILGSHK